MARIHNLSKETLKKIEVKLSFLDVVLGGVVVSVSDS